MAAEPNVALATLLKRLEGPLAVIGNRNRKVDAIEIDSRCVKPGALFVALRGEHTDGHRHANDAAGKGVRVVVVERAVDLPEDVTVVQVADSRRALSVLAAAFYGDPSHALDAVGVTGTNGKTTTTHMIAAVLNAGGISCGIAGTVGAEFRAHRWLLENTTPQPPELQRVLARMRDAGANAVAMEVSSHALALDRVEDVRFRVAALTNVTRDHLDFHETIEAYAAAKRRLFSLAPACVINADDKYGERWESELRREGRSVITYGVRNAASLAPEEIAVEPSGSRFTVNGQRYQLRLPGRFNIWNALAAIGVARFLGVADATSARALSELERVPGRMERLDAGEIAVVVDYAHTPDALESALRSLRETTSGALTVVFGCGGDRDRGKRPEMGAVAAVFADRLYVTSDNPRNEDPQAIADAIVAGIGDRDRIVELDRRRAIERAIAQARDGDVVLIAGKGHETYQIVGDRVLPFDDAAVAREALGSRSVLR
ncbi:MAG: UDP-N-acetylmuramoyl-L-alanyl-D-glutamate--2,6-diaminopimelate ligase [Candidatus Cybelea sp.]